MVATSRPEEHPADRPDSRGVNHVDRCAVIPLHEEVGHPVETGPVEEVASPFDPLHRRAAGVWILQLFQRPNQVVAQLLVLSARVTSPASSRPTTLRRIAPVMLCEGTVNARIPGVQRFA